MASHYFSCFMQNIHVAAQEEVDKTYTYPELIEVD